MRQAGASSSNVGVLRKAEPSGVVIPGLGSVDSSTLQDQIHSRLRAALMTGVFKPGDPITIRGVAQSFGVSIMPVRSAMLQLVSSGALEMPNSRATRVPSYSIERFQEVHRLRMLLEPEAAAQAASLATASAVKQLHRLQDRIMKAQQSDRSNDVLQLNHAFHFEVYRLSASPLLVQMIEDLWVLNGPHIWLVIDHNRRTFGGTFAHHYHLLEALEQGDQEGARAAIRRDLEDGARMFDNPA